MNSIKSWTVPAATIALVMLAGVMVTRTVHAWPRAQVQSETVDRVEPVRSITVVGEGRDKIKPDLAHVDIGVSVKNSTVQEATSEAEKVMDAVMIALKGHRIAKEDIQTSGFSIWADEYQPGPQSQSRDEVIYRVSNQVKVTIRDLDEVAAVLDAAIESGANSIYGVSFGLDDPTQAESDARKKASADALAKAQELASLHGAQLGALLSISEVVGSAANYEAMRGLGGVGGGGPISPGELELILRLQVVYALE
jgi:uncharacterized protein YggE